ncbi:MAG TPA: TRAM domain-containing protein [Myxococcales bacterium]|nr:TRAM domain-containing protein [Myxococcales bacterium]
MNSWKPWLCATKCCPTWIFHCSTLTTKCSWEWSQVTRELLTRLRQAIPEIILRTTFIVGFPGETDSAHESLMEFVAEQKFNHVGVFTYSPENGTKAFRFDDDVPEERKNFRRDQLMHMQQQISAEHMLNLVGKDVDVLVEGVSEETELLLQGRYTGQAPDVDGVTYINDGNPKVGDIVQCRVVQAGDYDLVVSVNE